MTARELIKKLSEELTEEEKDLPIGYDDSEWGAFDSEIKNFDIYRAVYGDKHEMVVLES